MDATWSFERLPDGPQRLVLRGELDIAHENRLVDDIDAHLREVETGVLVIDLSAVDFVDSSAVRALFRARRTHGARVVLGALSEPVRRVFDIAGVVQIFEGGATS